MKQLFIIFLLSIQATLSVGQKEIDYVRVVHCERNEDGKPAGEIYHQYFSADKGETYHYKMDEFENKEIKSSDFEWYSAELQKGISYSYNNEESEKSISISCHQLIPATGVYLSFEFELFNQKIYEESTITFEIENDTLEFIRAFEITSDIQKQFEKFILEHMKDPRPFSFDFPQIDLSSIGLPYYSYLHAISSNQNNKSKFISVDSTLLENNMYEVLRDSFYQWEMIKGDKIEHYSQFGKNLHMWEGELNTKSYDRRIILADNLKDTVYSLAITKNRVAKKPYQDIVVTNYRLAKTTGIDIQERAIHIEYDKIGRPTYREMHASTFDGQGVFSIWGKKFKEEENTSQLTVIDSTQKAHRIEPYPENVMLMTYWYPSRKPYKYKANNKRKSDKLIIKQIKSEYKLISKTDKVSRYYQKSGDAAYFTEVYYK